MKFYTINSEINLKERYIDNILFKQPKESYEGYVVLSFIGLIILNISKFKKESNDSIDFFFIIYIFLLVVLPILIRWYKYLFIYSHKKYIKYNEIKEIIKKDLNNTVETEVILLLNNKRKRIYTFRTTENVVDNFIVCLCSKIKTNNVC